MGDFNSRTSTSPDFNVTDDDKYTPVPEQYNSDEHESLYNRENEDVCSVNEYGKKLLELCIETELRILNGRMLGDLEGKLTCHKWNGSSTVDYGIVQNSLFREIDFFKVYDLMGHLSDHCLISLGLKCNFKAAASCNSNIYKLEKNFKWDTQSELIYKSTLVSSSVGKKIKDILNSGSDMTVEDMTNNVNDILLNSAKQALQQKKHMKRSAKKKKKWFDRDCFALRKEVIKLSRQLCRANATHETRILFFKRKKELRRFDDKQNRSSLLEERINEMLSCNSCSDLDFRITNDEIKKAISSRKCGKAPGLDKISSEMIKAAVNVLLSVYEKLFNAILRSGIYPTSWHDSYICPIYKSGSRSDPSNYRGIAITNILGKVFSIILNNRLEKFITSNNLIDDTQIGFKKNCRTSDHMFILQTLIDKYVKKLKSPLYVCFVDFRKAYDSVWRQALMFKLLSQNVSGMFFRIVKEMYIKNKICVKINNCERTTFLRVMLECSKEIILALDFLTFIFQT